MTRKRNTLSIIGSSPAVPRPNRANSCYLLETGDATIVLDLGSGALSKLFAVLDIARLDAVIVSHMHADHFFDIVPLRYALKYQIARERPLEVFLPPGGRGALAKVVSPLGSQTAFFRGLMRLHEYNCREPLRIGSVFIDFVMSRHYIPAYGMRVRTLGGVLTFSADTAPSPRITAAAHNADIFLCESGLGVNTEERGRRGHSNAREAGEMAHEAGAKHLILTHYPAGTSPEALVRAAGRAFKGPVSVADDGDRFYF